MQGVSPLGRVMRDGSYAARTVDRRGAGLGDVVGTDKSSK